MRDRSAPMDVRSSMQRERVVVTALLALQVVLWLGFAIHRSPRFPGSVSGAALAISGATLMVLPSLAYVAVKRIPGVKRLVTARLPLRTLLAWHLYGGILGSVLAILHTGHRFGSTLGITLTAAMLLTVFSGFVGRHFLRFVSLELREKQGLLDRLVTAYNDAARRLASQPQPLIALAVPQNGWLAIWRRSQLVARMRGDESLALAEQVADLAGAIADLEYAIKTHEHLKRRFAAWLAVHITTSVAFYVLLTLHIWASVYFGLRWIV